MGLFFFSVLVVFTLTTAIPAPCRTTCRFSFCTPADFPISSTPDVPHTPPICLGRRKIGVANSGEGLILVGSSFVPISEFSPAGLGQPFTPHFFKTLSIPPAYEYAGVSHETFQPGQDGFLNGACVALPITSYQKLRGGIVVDNIHPKRALVDCVAFRVRERRGSTPTTSKPVTTAATTTSVDTSTPSVITTDPPTTTGKTRTASPPTTDAPAVTTTKPPTTTKKTKPTTTTAKPPTTTKKTKPTSPPGTKPPTTTAGSKEPPVPSKVTPDGKVQFPSTTKLNAKTTFKVEVTVDAKSGSSKEDFYLLSDATGSMQDAIDEVKEKFKEVVAARQATSSDVAFGVGYYRDEAETSLEIFETVQPITKNTKQVIQGIDALEALAVANFDNEEANLYALYQVATSNSIGWREGSRRILVYFGDAPGHEPTCFGGKKLTRDNVIAALNKKQITVVATSFPDSGSGSPGLDVATVEFECSSSGSLESPEGQATAITTKTGGKLVELDEQEELIASILSSVGGLSQDLEADVSDCATQGVEVSFKPVLPLTIEAGKTVTVEETVVVKPGVCGAGGSGFSCKVEFTLSGAKAGTQVLSSKGIAEC